MIDDRTDTRRPVPLASIRSLAPYRQGKAKLDDVAQPLKLSSNESMIGPSEKAVAAYRDCGARLALYPDGSQAALRTAIGRVHGLDPDLILCGNGSDELIQLIIRAYVGQGDDVVISQNSFAMAFVHAIAQGANVVTAPEAGMRPDADAILAAVSPRTKLVILASPNNPIGQYIPREELLRLHRSLPSDVLLLIDGAYADYVDEPDFEAGDGLVQRQGNVVMTRTFSKLYGLAGLRIGWMYAPEEVIDSVQRIRTPFNVNAAALAAAEAAVCDTDHADMVRHENKTELARIAERVEKVGMRFIPSVANFYLLRFPNGLTPDGAARHLEARGIIPRPVNAGGPAEVLRITVGRPEQNDRVIAALTEFVGA